MPDLLLISTVVLWLLVLGLLFVVFALARQIGVLHERLAPAGGLQASRGILVGEAVPTAQLTDLLGRSVGFGGGRARALLTLFVSPTCPICRTLAPVAAELAQRDGIDLLFASEGNAADARDLDTHQRYAAAQGLEAPYVLTSELGRAHQVTQLPFALLIDAAGVLRAKGAVNARDQLERLLASAALSTAAPGAGVQQFEPAGGRS